MNLEIRKAALTARGWPLTQQPNGYWSLFRDDGSSQSNWHLFHDDGIEAWSNADAIESDPAISEPMFLAFCAKHKLDWSLQPCTPHDQFTELHYVIWVMSGEKDVDVEVEAETPSLARAKALIKVAEKLK